MFGMIVPPTVETIVPPKRAPLHSIRVLSGCSSIYRPVRSKRNRDDSSYSHQSNDKQVSDPSGSALFGGKRYALMVHEERLKNCTHGGSQN